MWGVYKLRRLHFPTKQRHQTSLGKEEMGFVWFTPKADVQVGPCYSQCKLTSQFEFSSNVFTYLLVLVYIWGLMGLPECLVRSITPCSNP